MLFARTATVLCKEMTILGKLSRRLYNRILCNEITFCEKN